MEGLTAKDILDKVTGTTDLGITLISGSVALFVDEVADLSPTPSGTTAVIAIGTLLGLKKIGQAVVEGRRSARVAEAYPGAVRARAVETRGAFVDSGRFDLADKLFEDLELNGRKILPAEGLEESTNATLARFRSEPDVNRSARENLKDVLQAAERSRGALAGLGGSEGVLRSLHDGSVDIDEVRGDLQPWLEDAEDDVAL